MSNHRKTGRHCASFGLFTILSAPDSRRQNHQVFARGLAISVFSHKMPSSLPQSSTAPSTYEHLPGELEDNFNSASCVDNSDINLKRISLLRCFYRIPIRIPKSCRIPVAEALAVAINRMLTSVSNTELSGLVLFQILSMGISISQNTTGSSLFSIIRANLRRLTRSPANLDTLCQQLPSHHARKETSSYVNLRSHINSI